MKTIDYLFQAEKREMTEIESRMFVLLCLHERAKVIHDERAKDIHEDIVNSFLYQILKKRLQYFDVPVTEHLIAFISLIIDRPAKAVMWAYTLNRMFKERQREIDIKIFSDYGYFADGIPTEEEYQRIWDSQKVKSEFPKSDNALDDPDYWQ